MTEVHEALRRWGNGLYSIEAGVEHLIRSFDGRFANPGQPGLQPGDDPGWWWIDVEQMDEDNYGALSGGETPPAPNRGFTLGRSASRPAPQPRRPRSRATDVVSGLQRPHLFAGQQPLLTRRAMDDGYRMPKDGPDL